MPADLLESLPLAGIGALAALIAAGAKSHRWQLPRIVRENSAEGGQVVLVDLGFLAAPLCGAITAAAMATSMKQAFWAGCAAGVMGPAILNTLLEPLLGRLGLPAASQSNSGEAPNGADPS